MIQGKQNQGYHCCFLCLCVLFWFGSVPSLSGLYHHSIHLPCLHTHCSSKVICLPDLSLACLSTLVTYLSFHLLYSSIQILARAVPPAWNTIPSFHLANSQASFTSLRRYRICTEGSLALQAGLVSLLYVLLTPDIFPFLERSIVVITSSGM